MDLSLPTLTFLNAAWIVSGLYCDAATKKREAMDNGGEKERKEERDRKDRKDPNPS